jgi:hypothetical protein
MARCIECAWFPWKPGADLSGLPAMRCHPDMPLRRWSNAGAEAETTCERYWGEPPARAATPVGVLTEEPKTQDAPPPEAPTPDEVLGEPPTEEPEGQDTTPGGAPDNPEDAPAAAETPAEHQPKGPETQDEPAPEALTPDETSDKPKKKGGSKQKKGD